MRCPYGWRTFVSTMNRSWIPWKTTSKNYKQLKKRIMENKNVKSNDTSDSELLITRTLNAPVQLVWEVWTNPEHIKNWWGPNGFTNTIHNMDVQSGGTWDFIMHGPDGTDYRNKNIFKEIVKHKKIVFEH